LRPRIVIRYVGMVLIINAIALLIAAAVSLYYGDSSFSTLLYSSLISASFGFFPLIFVPAVSHLTNDEGILIVISSWILISLIGALPFVLWGGEFTFTNAWFESVSGFTTTGSSILNNIEALPMGLLFWRSLTHWLGGLGIIIFVLSLLPSMGMSGLVLIRNEMSPLARNNFRANAKNTLRILLIVYVGLTVLETVALKICGMSVFDAVTHSFATIATGGFSTKNLSIAHFNSVAVESVIMVFMIFSGIHFGILFMTLIGSKLILFKSTVVHYYVAALLIGTFISAYDIYGHYSSSWWEALRFASFQVISLGTSTGFANADSSVWPALSKVILMFFALQCACAGSTSGGIKVDRFVLLWKDIIRQLRLLRHPNAIIPVRLDGEKIEDSVVSQSVLYIVVYLTVIFAASTVLIALGVEVVPSISGTIATMGNVGPGLSYVGSTGNFSQIPDAGKWILTGTMLLGRLEIYGLLIFLLPKSWIPRNTTNAIYK